ncbi:MAG: carbohydrate-binding protein [Deltaproteobacteria bacterium]|nr:carbohydrate-binding protein [Deltaproteobacteria bacterium]
MRSRHACLAFLLVGLLSAPGRAAERLLYDGVMTYDDSENAFYWFGVPASNPADWTAPDDFAHGEWHARFEIVDQPSYATYGEPTGLQSCIWQDGKGGDYPETCSGISFLDGPGSVVYTVETPTSWWEKHDSQASAAPFDWARGGDFVDMGSPTWHQNGDGSCCLATIASWGGCEENMPHHLPMTIRQTIVLVSSGSAFSGWASYGFGGDAEPIGLHPDNPHYFIYRGQPLALITCAEHYGAVLNLDFDQDTYLDTLQADGLNYTRIFAGSYIEHAGWFDYPDAQPLSPAAGRAIAPWARSDTPGYIGGGNKFDLDAFDPAYFARLKGFVGKARDRGIIVELTLFCTFYTDELWLYSPFHPDNNVSGVGNISRDDFQSLDNGGVLAYQEAMVEKIVDELAGFDNLFFEISNEPYLAPDQDAVAEWQAHIAQRIAVRESGLGHRHLIAQNINNHSRRISDPDPNVSIFNFHYATVAAVDENHGLDKVIGNDEEGFDNSDAHYRRDAWDFVIHGGGLQNVLDLSFLVGDEAGSIRPPSGVPAGGGPILRGQIRILSEFIHGLDFVRMRPDASPITGGVPSGASACALVEDGAQYAIYVNMQEIGGDSQADLEVDLPAGSYESKWLDTKTGAYLDPTSFDHPGGQRTIASPVFQEDIALLILSRDELRPSVQITSPRDGERIAEGADVRIEASASASYGSIDHVEFRIDESSLGTDSESPYAIEWPDAALGEHRITATAVDNLGHTAQDQIRVNVTSGETRGVFLEAEEYDEMSGITDSGEYIESCDDGDWIRFDNVDFEAGYTSLVIRAGRPSDTNSMHAEIRADAMDGPLVADFVPEGTGDWYVFEDQSVTPAVISGVHDLYVLFLGGYGVGNFDWFHFVDPVPVPDGGQDGADGGDGGAQPDAGLDGGADAGADRAADADTIDGGCGCGAYAGAGSGIWLLLALGLFRLVPAKKQ